MVTQVNQNGCKLSDRDDSTSRVALSGVPRLFFGTQFVSEFNIPTALGI